MLQAKDFQEFSNSSRCSSEIAEQFLLWATPVPTVYRSWEEARHISSTLPRVDIIHQLLYTTLWVQFQTMRPSPGPSEAFPGWPLMCMPPWVQLVTHFLADLFPFLCLRPSRRAHLSPIPHKALLTSSDCPIAKQLFHGQLPRTPFLLPDITSTSRQCSVGWIRVLFLLTELQIRNNGHLPQRLSSLSIQPTNSTDLGFWFLDLFCFVFVLRFIFIPECYIWGTMCMSVPQVRREHQKHLLVTDSVSWSMWVLETELETWDLNPGSLAEPQVLLTTV